MFKKKSASINVFICIANKALCAISSSLFKRPTVLQFLHHSPDKISPADWMIWGSWHAESVSSELWIYMGLHLFDCVAHVLSAGSVWLEWTWQQKFLRASVLVSIFYTDLRLPITRVLTWGFSIQTHFLFDIQHFHCLLSLLKYVLLRKTPQYLVDLLCYSWLFLSVCLYLN